MWELRIARFIMCICQFLGFLAKTSLEAQEILYSLMVKKFKWYSVYQNLFRLIIKLRVYLSIIEKNLPVLQCQVSVETKPAGSTETITMLYISSIHIKIAYVFKFTNSCAK